MSGSSPEILQEYLISLGYKVNAASQKKFEDSFGIIGKRIFTVGTAIAATVTAIVGATTAFAYSMRKVYFQSELANTSVKNLKAFEFAGVQVGISSNAMASALENAGAMMRSFSQRTAFEGLTGISTKGKEASTVLQEFLLHMKKMEAENPAWHQLGAGFAAQFFGMSEGDYTLAINHYDELIAKQKQMKQAYKDAGFDPDDPKNKRAVMEYTSAINSMKLSVDLLANSLMSKVLTGLTETAQQIKAGADYWGRWLSGGEKVGAMLSNITNKDNGGVLGFLKWFLSWNPDRDLDKKLTPAGPDSDLAKKLTPAGNEAHGLITKGKAAAPVKAPVIGKTSQSVISRLQQYGWSKAQAAGIAANLWKESAFDPKIIGDSGRAYGIGQWHKSRQDDFKKWSGHDIHGSTLEEQLGFYNYELTQGKEKSAGDRLRRATSASEAGQIVSRYDERPRDQARQMAVRGTLATRLGTDSTSNVVSINQTNNFNIHGGDAHSTANLIADKQKGVSADIARNTKVALR